MANAGSIELFQRHGVALVLEHFGLWGGGMPKAAWLLAKELRALGVPVSVSVLHTTVGDIERARGIGIPVWRGWCRWGHRWRLPQRTLALATIARAARRKHALILGLGLDPLAAFLLASPLRRRFAVWECTEATPNNKFVWPGAVRRLHRGLAVLAPSQAIETNVRATYAYSGPLIRLPFWIDAGEARGHEAGEQASETDFLFLGRKDPEKGLFELIRAFAEVLREQPRARLTLCGTGADAPYAELIHSLGIQSQVRLTYLPDHEQVGSLILRSRWLVLPSYHEGYPLTPLEGFARSRPVIVTAVGSVPEMCGGSPAALLIPPRDVAALRSAMLQALAEPASEYRRRQREAYQCFDRLCSSAAIESNLSLALAALAKQISEQHPAQFHAS